jgi:hypothetical protein
MNRTMNQTTKALAAAGLALTIAAPVMAQVDVSLRTIVLRDTPHPSLPMDTAFDRFDAPRINEDGRIAFTARLMGPPVTNIDDGSVWTDRSGGLEMVYRENGGAPFAIDIRYAGFASPAFNEHAALAFSAGLFDNSGPALQPTNVAIIQEEPTFFVFPVAREGFNAPGTTMSFASIPLAPFNGAGQTAFGSSLTDGTFFERRAGVWTFEPGGTLDNVALAGSPAPGVPGYELLQLGDPTQSATGDIVFRATLIDPAANPIPDFLPLAIYRPDGAGSLELIAWTDPSIPPIGQAHFEDLSREPALAYDGTVTFWGRQIGDLITEETDAAIFRTSSSGLVELVREGDAAPGTGAQFSRITPEFAHNDSGQIAMAAYVAGTGVNPDNNSGVWARLDPGAGFELIAREGDAAPGVANAEFAMFGSPTINRVGQVTFHAQLRGPGVDPTSNAALYTTDVAGNLVLVAKTGQILEVEPGRFETITEVDFTSEPYETGRSQYNGKRQMVMTLEFETLTYGVFEARIGCLADFDASNSLDVFDFLAFQDFFATGNPIADINADHVLDIFDFLDFQDAFAAGCP